MILSGAGTGQPNRRDSLEEVNGRPDAEVVVAVDLQGREDIRLVTKPVRDAGLTDLLRDLHRLVPVSPIEGCDGDHRLIGEGAILRRLEVRVFLPILTAVGLEQSTMGLN